MRSSRPDAAGIKAGAGLTRWGGRAADKALAETSTIFSKDSLATKEDVTYERLMFLVRAPVGEAKQVTFKDPGDTAARTVTLTAVNDGMETLAFANPFYDSKALKPRKLIEARTLYEYQNWYNAKNGKMEIWLGSDQTRQYGDPGKSLDIVPGTPRFDGPIVAIVNTGCISSGEGVAMGVKNLPDGEVVGFWGTNGLFGMSGDEARMPDGLAVSFPFGQSLDKDKVVQLDSRNGMGGVAPSKRIPMTLENALKWGAGQDIELEYALKTLAAMGKGN